MNKTTSGPPGPARELWRYRRSLIIRLAVLAAIFVSVPVILYGQFKDADATKNQLLQHSLEQQGRLIAEALRPSLEEFRNGERERPQVMIARFAGSQLEGEPFNIRVLFRPRDTEEIDGFYYVGSSPTASSDYLKSERGNLIEAGIFGELAGTCEGTGQSFVRFRNPSGHEEILTSLTPMHLANGCWVIITSNSTAALLQSSIGTAYWRAPNVQFAGIIYIASAVIICWLLIDIWRNLHRFRVAARRIRLRGPNGSSFREINRVPELAGVAEDFDSLVERLAASQEAIREAAEENAHALKTPLAVIAQSVEPIRAALPRSAQRASRSLELIEQSVERLDTLVTMARNLDQANADVIYPVKRKIDISAVLARSLDSYRAALALDGKTLVTDIEPGLVALADQDMLEPILENLLENAAGFSPWGSVLEVTLQRRGRQIDLSVCDRGPGVDPDDLDQIFERYYSNRPAGSDRNGGSAPPQANGHFGLGLWIVKRNVEGLGGTVTARNRDGGGLEVTVSMQT